MKLIYSTVFLLLFCSAVNAQLINESFDNTTFPPTGWQNIVVSTGIANSGDADGDVFTRVTTGTNPTCLPQSGLGMVKYASFDFNINSSAALITPVLNFSSGTYRVRLWIYRDAGFGDNLDSVTISVNTTASLAGATILGSVIRNYLRNPIESAPGWYQYSFDILASFNTASNYIIIQALGRYGNNMFFDNVVVEQKTDCSGTPDTGIASNSTPILCSSATSSLSCTGVSLGTGITYQWQSSPAGANNFTNISGATTTNYTTNVLTVSTDFRLVTTCSLSGLSANSNITTVTISGIPSNDEACNAITLTQGSALTCGNTLCATSVADPTFSNSTPNNTVWYKFTPTTTGATTIRFKRPIGVTSGLLYGWLGIYTATGSCPTLTLAEVPSSLSFDLTTFDSVTVETPSLTAGTTYYFMVDGFSNAKGAFCISMPIVTAPVCTTNLTPANLATGIAMPITLTWNTAADATSYDVYWSANNGVNYTLIGNINTNSALITNTNANTTYYWYVNPKNTAGTASCVTTATSFTTIMGPSNDDCANAVTLSNNTSVNGTTVNAGPSGVAVCTPAAGTPDDDVWYKFTATADSCIITVAGSTGFDAVVGVYSGTCANLVQLGACRDTSANAATEIYRSGGLTVGTTYYVRVYGYNNGSGFGTFTVTYVAAATLPITLQSFVGERKGNSNILTWVTANENNNKGFEIQRSIDGKNFTALSFINSKALGGNSSNNIIYNFEDAKLLPSTTGYYRLKQVDNDGKFSLSNVVIIKAGTFNTIQIVAAYPNPVKNITNISLESPTNTKLQITVVDAMGKQVAIHNVAVQKGQNNIPLQLASLQAGTYFIKAICADGCISTAIKINKE